MAELPRGAITLLFADIDGATRLLHQLGDHYNTLLKDYQQIVRAAIAAAGGREVDTSGESFFATFVTPRQALAAAIDVQHSLAKHPWPEEAEVCARVALHTGTPQPTGDGYVGIDVHRAARLCAAGHGGQILVSETTRPRLVQDLPDGGQMLDLGSYRLKDLPHPERIYQLIVPDLAADFPPLHAPVHELNNLPPQPTRFIGRDREVSDVRAQLLRPGVCLLTLTGPGGTGKTRLALAVAAEFKGEFPDGVWVVECAAINDPAMVPFAIAHTLGLKGTSEHSLRESLAALLHPKHMLLVLDNFEQLITAAPLVAELLDAAPEVKALITSRIPLGLSCEHEFAVPPLALPDLSQLPPLASLTRYPAVELFITRAQAVKPDFALTQGNAAAAVAICARLDGLPLAIELAAARAKIFSPQALLARLDRRLSLLVGGARDLPRRQQTLRGAIDWSYNLLSPDEQLLFARLAVFVGGFSLEAVEAVCNTQRDLTIAVLDGVHSLCAKSLLRQMEGVADDTTFVMLETIREYALERLQASGELEVIQERHAAYYLALAEVAHPALAGPQRELWSRRLEVAHDNLRSVLTWALEHGEVEVALRVSIALTTFWLFKGYLTEGRRWLHAALERSDGNQVAPPGRRVEPAVQAEALYRAAWLALRQVDYGAARALAERALAWYRDLQDTHGIILALHALANIAGNEGNYAVARAMDEEGLALQRDLDDLPGLADSLNSAGWHAHLAGDDERAIALLEESIALYHRVSEAHGAMYAINSLAMTLVDRGEYLRARALLVEGLALVRRLENKEQLVYYLEAFAWIAAPLAAARGQPHEGALRAARLFGAAEALGEAIGGPLSTVERAMHARHLAAARAHVDAASWESALAEGRAMAPEQAIEYALEDDGQRD